MKHLQVFDPAMCCSTGVCGPSVDSKLVKLAADLAFLKSQGVRVERFNLARQPEAFTANPLVVSEMGPGAEHLPLFVVDGTLRAKGVYPTRQELAAWFELDTGTSRHRHVGVRALARRPEPERLASSSEAPGEPGGARTELKMAAAPCCESGEEGCC
ncbi:MAG: arsenite efflux transporter metallochaperone ArsD [Fimbriimonadaceae bacterium]|nr:arsenite efflux transporter metallochaperone ArsD [Fimbriimonadaceae bacterium]